MDYISVMIDSVETSVTMKIFKNKKDASFAHIFKSKLLKMPLSIFKDVDNFNPDRLQKSAIKAYPLNDRPRGNSDISSVKYYQKQIQQNKKYILLDGAHRIVASYIEGIQEIYAYIINV